MIIDSYMCPNCLVPKEFKVEDRGKPHTCPNCGCEMDYWVTEVFDDNTGKVINSSDKDKSLEPPNVTDITDKPAYKINTQPTTPVVQCPYCKSTNTKKITTTSKAVHTALFGIFSMGRNSKQWHCDNCGSDF